MEREQLEIPEIPERTITLTWTKAKDTLNLALIGLLSTLALNTLGGLRGAVEKLTDKVEIIVSSQGVLKDHSETQDRRMNALEDRQTYLERQQLSVNQSRH